MLACSANSETKRRASSSVHRWSPRAELSLAALVMPLGGHSALLLAPSHQMSHFSLGTILSMLYFSRILLICGVNFGKPASKCPSLLAIIWMLRSLRLFAT